MVTSLRLSTLMPLTISLIIFFIPNAFAGLSAFPQHIEIERHQRNSVLTLTNSGSTTQYRIQLVDYIRDKNGKVQSVPLNELPENYNSAKKIVRYSPRQITLAPGESQTIRLLVRRTRKLPTAEYRSFILFQAMPSKEQTKNDIQNLAETDPEKRTITVNPVMLQSLALPIIVQHGKLSATAEIASLTFKQSQTGETAVKNPKINVHLLRHGNRSLYGKIVAEQDGDVIGIAKGLALYNPNKERTYTVALDPKKLQSGKKLTVTYRGLDRDAGTTFATGEIIVP